MVCEREDAAAVIVFARFTHRRSGRSISTVIAHFLRFRQGLIVEWREFMDSFGAVRQLLGWPLNVEQSAINQGRSARSAVYESDFHVERAFSARDALF